MSNVVIGATAMGREDVVRVLREDATVRFGEDAIAAIERSRSTVESLASQDAAVYGVTTGFGALASVRVEPALRSRLQLNYIRSHAAGTGAEVPREVVRGLMLMRLSTMATGCTGIRLETALAYMALLNARITPIVHEYGSLGCSGDLAPLAHCALAVLGEGQVRSAKGVVVNAADALADAGLEPVTLEAKEGIALINGTDGMLGMLVLACHDLRRLLTSADVISAMSLEGQLGTDSVFAPDLTAMRPHPGIAESAENIRTVLRGSELLQTHSGPARVRVQDAYSIRCTPQVHGAARDTLTHAELVADRELASAIDNPVVMPDGRIESNGNFHGAPLGFVLDFLAIAVADTASIAERRTDRFLDVARNHQLLPFLADDPGVDSGMMIAQYTQAAIVSELKRLATPASVDSIPSSAMQEDHVSMGWAAALKLRKSIDGFGRVLAVEMLTAARALDLRAPEQPSPVTGAVRDLLRQSVEGPGPDRILAPEIQSAFELIMSGELVRVASASLGASLA